MPTVPTVTNKKTIEFILIDSTTNKLDPIKRIVKKFNETTGFPCFLVSQLCNTHEEKNKTPPMSPSVPSISSLRPDTAYQIRTIYSHFTILSTEYGSFSL